MCDEVTAWALPIIHGTHPEALADCPNDDKRDGSRLLGLVSVWRPSRSASAAEHASHLHIMNAAVIFTWNIYEGHSNESRVNETFGLYHWEALPGLKAHY